MFPFFLPALSSLPDLTYVSLYRSVCLTHPLTHSQQWILTTVGTVTFIVGVLSFIIIPEYPHSAPGLTAEEKDLVSEAVAVSRGDEEHDESIVSAFKGGFTSIDAWLFT